MRKVLFQKFGQVSTSVKPSILRYSYKELTVETLSNIPYVSNIPYGVNFLWPIKFLFCNGTNQINVVQLMSKNKILNLHTRF